MASPQADQGFDRNRLVAALRASRCGTWRWDIVNNVVDWDEALSDLYGIEHKNAPKTAEAFFALVHPEDRERISKALDQCFASGTEVEYDFRAIVNGMTRWIYDRSQLTRNKDGSPAHFTGACLDVTERKRIEHELNVALHQQQMLLRELEEARDVALVKRAEAEAATASNTSFLANMSHELRTPLNAILGFSEIIAQESLGPVGIARYKEYASDIHSSGAHLLSLISDLLDVAKIEASKMEINPERIETEKTIGYALKLLSSKTRDRHQAIGVQIDDDARELFADERALKQIVINLVSNAVKFTQDGGRIDIAARRNHAGYFELTVADNGPGIPAGDVDRIFKPFSRVNNYYHSENSGTGLGLALVRGLAELHGGRAWIDSDEGKGTRVYVALPMNAARETVRRRSSA